MQCYFCTQEINGPAEHHHPDKEHFPDWTESTHPECHTRYHQSANHFKHWGAQSAYAGRPGYERVIAKWPGFHRMGGLARARSAERDERGRFVAETGPVYGLGVPTRTPPDISRMPYHERVREQTRRMTTGPFLAADGYTLVVPSEWYNEDAVRFWKAKDFEWRPKTSTWKRDTRKPLYGKTYTAAAWLEATRTRFYQFWPELLKCCHRCGRQFLPISLYQIHCLDCCA